MAAAAWEWGRRLPHTISSRKMCLTSASNSWIFQKEGRNLLPSALYSLPQHEYTTSVWTEHMHEPNFCF